MFFRNEDKRVTNQLELAARKLASLSEEDPCDDDAWHLEIVKENYTDLIPMVRIDK